MGNISIAFNLVDHMSGKLDKISNAGNRLEKALEQVNCYCPHHLSKINRY